MKIQDIMKENQASVREGRLNEFAPGGSEGNGPFEYGTAIIQIGEDFVDTYSDEGAGADAAAIIKVGRKFMSAGMKAGIRAFYAMDTQLRDHVAEELEDQGFNVRKDIYEPHDKSLPATTWTRPVTDADRDWYLLQDLIKEFSKARQGSVDPKTLEQLRQDFGWSLQMGFLELPKKSIRADFTDFAKSKGVDLTAMAKKYEVRRPADKDIKDRGVSEASGNAAKIRAELKNRLAETKDSKLEENPINVFKKAGAGVSPSQAGVTASPKQTAKSAVPAAAAGAGVSPSQVRVTASPKQAAKPAAPAAAPVSTELNPIVKENLPIGLRQIADGIEQGNFKSIQDVMKEIKFLADQLVKQSTGQGVAEGRRR